MFDAQNDKPEIFSSYIKSAEVPYLLVANKSDKISTELENKLQSAGCVLISVKENKGINVLTDKIYESFQNMYEKGAAQLITRQRYKESLMECLENLTRFNLQKEIELSAEDIRLACREIGKITGQVEVDEILDKIFSSFCIGK